MRSRAALLAVVTMLTQTLTAPADEPASDAMRIWRSVSGNEVKAAFVEFSAGRIVLETEDGQRVGIVREALVEADREYVRRLVTPTEAAAPAPAAAAEKEAVPHPLLTPGKTSAEIFAPGADKWSYHVYAPKSFSADRLYPILFIMSPGGGNPRELDRYIPGAERNHWLLAVSVQSKNNFKGSGDAVESMVYDALEKLPVDRRRLYASGFSGGSRMAAGLVQRRKTPFAGIIACGAGSPLQSIPRDVVAFGLCGSNCFNRWDMACSFKSIANTDSALEFFPGNHDWAGAEYLTYAMTWLNAAFLRSAPRGDAALQKERETLRALLAADIDRLRDTDPEIAFDWTRCMTVLQPATGIVAQRELEALRRNPQIALYQSARDDMDKFVRTHFATSPMDYANANNGNPRAKKAADDLAEKYKDTRLGALFSRMGEKAKTP